MRPYQSGFAGVLVVDEHGADVGDGEVEFGRAEEIVGDAAVEQGGVAFEVSEPDVAQGDESRGEVDGVGGGVVGVGEIEFEFEVFGHDVAFEVDIVEVAEDVDVARAEARDVGGERAHVVFHESDAGAVGADCEVETAGEGVEAAVDSGFPAIGLGYEAVDDYRLFGHVEVAFDNGVAEHAAVEGDVGNIDAGGVDLGHGG